jgi:hypothetical protein
LRRRHPPGPAEAEGVTPTDIAPSDLAIIERCAPYTMTGRARVLSLLEAVEYCVRAEVPGAFAECGVWRGGSVLAMVLKLQERGVRDRPIYLYDTFEGMTRPSEQDTSSYDRPALETWDEEVARGAKPWEYLFDDEVFNQESVRRLLVATGYPAECLHFVAGPVEETLPGTMPDRLALLRLDTDWYESTKHELVHLYPNLSTGGVLIVDDYGHWTGSRKAVDEYLAEQSQPLLLHRVDYACRIAVKT